MVLYKFEATHWLKWKIISWIHYLIWKVEQLLPILIDHKQAYPKDLYSILPAWYERARNHNENHIMYSNYIILLIILYWLHSNVQLLLLNKNTISSFCYIVPETTATSPLKQVICLFFKTFNQQWNIRNNNIDVIS